METIEDRRMWEYELCFQLLTSIKESKEFRIREVVGEIGTVAISLTDNKIIIIIKLFSSG